MVDVDIDKILEKTEKMEEEKKKKQKLVLILISSAAVILLVIFIFVLINIILGEKSTVYFPLKSGIKFIYNKKNQSPEEWEILKKVENINNYECKILNVIDKGTFFTKQEYYYAGKKEGIIRLAVSKDYGKKTKAGFKLLPPRIKKGMEFKAGKIKDEIVNAKIEEKETLSLPIGTLDTYRVHYKAEPYYDEIIWFAKNTGIVKKVDNVNNIELNIINMEQK